MAYAYGHSLDLLRHLKLLHIIVQYNYNCTITRYTGIHALCALHANCGAQYRGSIAVLFTVQLTLSGEGDW